MENTEGKTTEVSPVLAKLYEKGDIELLTIRLSDATTNKIPEKLYEWVFHKYLKDNGIEKEVSTPQELATYVVLKRLEALDAEKTEN